MVLYKNCTIYLAVALKDGQYWKIIIDVHCTLCQMHVGLGTNWKSHQGRVQIWGYLDGIIGNITIFDGDKEIDSLFNVL